MAEPPSRTVTPAGRPGPGGRLGLLAWLVVPALALATLTQLQVARAGPDLAGTTDPDLGDPAGPRLAFGSVTRQGAILFEVGEPARARAFGSDGRVRWERTLADGDYLVCGPCPAAVLVHHPGTGEVGPGWVRTIAADGLEGPPPAALAPDRGLRPVAATALHGVVVAASRPDGTVEFRTATSDGLVLAGAVADAGLDRPLVVVTPADRGGAVTVMRVAADPLRQGEFEVEHITPAGATTATVPLDAPGSRPMPCAVADASFVGYLQIDRGPTADGTTHVVAERDGARLLDTRVPGSFDTCSVGSAGAVLAATANGADGDLSRTRVDLRWIDPAGEVHAPPPEQVVATSASVAIDAATGRVAVAGGSGPAVVVDPTSRLERAPARAVAFDDSGGLWWADDDATVTREERP